MSVSFRPHQIEGIGAMNMNDCGIICLPTGAGKTLIGIGDVMESFKDPTTIHTICVVSPKILLACQLCSEYLDHMDSNVRILHVHTGKTSHYNTTNPKNISDWVNIHKNHNKLIFSTYHSLRRIQESNIKVDTYLMDEAHNSVRRSFYEHVQTAKSRSKRCYFFTATPKISHTVSKPGMNNKEVYGEIIYSVPATKLAENGYILKPKVVTKEIDNHENPLDRDHEFIKKIISEDHVNKLMISVKSTPNMMSLFTETSFKQTLKDLDYSLLHITSKYGAYIDDKKVTRDKFFRVLNMWGKERDKKFVVMNHSILGEGINVNCLDAVCFMRSMDIVGLLQNTGRTLRLDPSDAEAIQNGKIIAGDFSSYLKPEGLVILPVFDKSTKLLSVQIQSIMNSVFEQGQIVYSEIKK